MVVTHDEMPICPLAGCRRVSLVERIGRADLVRVYAGVDIAADLGEHRSIGLFRCTDCDLRFFHPAITGSTAFYQQMQQLHPRYYLADKPEFAFARQRLDERDRVLDVGCGGGAFGQGLRVAAYVGLELSPDAVAHARRAGLTVLAETVQDHAAAHAGAYDAVCAFQVLEHVADPRSFVAASVRCLRPGGRLIYSVPNADAFVAAMFNAASNLPPHHVTWWSGKALAGLARAFDLTVEVLHPEPLSADHALSYGHVLCLRALMDRLGMRHSGLLIPRRLPFRVLSKLATLGARLLRPALLDPRLSPPGHSITAVYRKGPALDTRPSP